MNKNQILQQIKKLNKDLKDIEGKTNIPISEYNSFKKQLKNLLYQDFDIYIEKYDLNALGRFEWKSDVSPDIYIESIISRSKNKAHNLLVSHIDVEYDEDFNDRLVEELKKNKSYKEYKRQILDLCKQSDTLEKVYEDFDFNDVLTELGE